MVSDPVKNFLNKIFLYDFGLRKEKFASDLVGQLTDNGCMPVCGSAILTEQLKEDGVTKPSSRTEILFSFIDPEGKIHSPVLGMCGPGYKLSSTINEVVACYDIFRSKESYEDEKWLQQFECEFVQMRADKVIDQGADVQAVCWEYDLSSGIKILRSAESIAFQGMRNKTAGEFDLGSEEVMYVGQAENHDWVNVYVTELGIWVFETGGKSLSTWIANQRQDSKVDPVAIDMLAYLARLEQPPASLIARGLKAFCGTPWIKTSELFPADEYLKGERRLTISVDNSSWKLKKEEMFLVKYGNIRLFLPYSVGIIPTKNMQ